MERILKLRLTDVMWPLVTVRMSRRAAALVTLASLLAALVLASAAEASHSYSTVNYANLIPRSQNQYVNSESNRHTGARAKVHSSHLTAHAAVRNYSNGQIYVDATGGSDTSVHVHTTSYPNSMASARWQRAGTVVGQTDVSGWAYRIP